jgi:hypothetical protein
MPKTRECILTNEGMHPNKGGLLFISNGSFAIMMIVFGTHKLRQFVNYVFLSWERLPYKVVVMYQG